MNQPGGKPAFPLPPRRAGSLRWRITLMILALSAIIQGVIGVVATLYLRREVNAYFDDRLKARVRQAAQRLSGDAPPTPQDVERVAREWVHHWFLDHTVLTIYKPDGTIIATSGTAIDPGVLNLAEAADRPGAPLTRLLPGDAFPQASGDEAGTQARAALLGVGRAGGVSYVVSLARVETDIAKIVRSLELAIFMLVAVGIGASSAAGWFVTGRVLSLLIPLTNLATSLRPDQLEEDAPDPTVRDSELRTMQSALTEARRSMREAFRAQERFLSNVAHELKTPIAVLLAESQTLPRSTVDGPAAAFVNSVEEELRRLGRLVDSFLLLAKVRAGTAALRSEASPVNEIVMGAVEQCTLMARQYRVSLQPLLIEDDPPGHAVAGDVTLLQTMIDQLIRNAIKFSPQRATVRVHASIENSHAMISVRDQGPGIPAEIAETIFDRFVQAPSETARSRGTGLGLAIAQGIAELHSGKISFRNLDAGGCEFTARLPLVGWAEPALTREG